MHIKVLGSAAGGGFPQWNCYCNNCVAARKGEIKSQVCMQSSIVILENNKRILINVSPDIHQQISTLAITTANQKREDLFSAIILLDSQLDHTLGLLSLREAKHLKIYATDNVLQDLHEDFSVIKILSRYCGVECKRIILQQNFVISDIPYLEFTAISLKSKAPPYSRRRAHYSDGETIGLLIKDTFSGKNLFYAPSIGYINQDLFNLMEQSDCVLVDGTFWHADEMQQNGVGHKSAQDMGHIPLMGEAGMLTTLKQLARSRKILTHINNTNPILNTHSTEYAELCKHNIEVAYDGMDIRL